MLRADSEKELSSRNLLDMSGFRKDWKLLNKDQSCWNFWMSEDSSCFLSVLPIVQVGEQTKLSVKHCLGTSVTNGVSGQKKVAVIFPWVHRWGNEQIHSAFLTKYWLFVLKVLLCWRKSQSICFPDKKHGWKYKTLSKFPEDTGKLQSHKEACGFTKTLKHIWQQRASQNPGHLLP